METVIKRTRRRVRSGKKLWTMPSDDEIKAMLGRIEEDPVKEWVIFYNWKLGMIFHVDIKDLLNFDLNFVLDNILLNKGERKDCTLERIKYLIEIFIINKKNILKDVDDLSRFFKKGKHKREDFSNTEYLHLL